MDPAGLKGLWLRARSGPVRDRFLARLPALPLPLKRIHPTMGDDALYGGVDLAATLSAGALRRTRGLLAEPAALVLTMAERCTAGLGARLAHALDTPGHCLVALDEGLDDDDGLPIALIDRVGLFVDLNGIPLGATDEDAPDLQELATARALLPEVTMPAEALDDLARVAARLGISSLRAPLLARMAARASAALNGRTAVTQDDLSLAVELVFAHRATQFPQPEDETAQDDPPPPEHEQDPPEDDAESDGADPAEDLRLPDEILIEAARAALPPDVLAALAAGRAQRVAQGSSGTGAKRKGNRRGRPLPSRPGKLDGSNRIDLPATLRAAAPWQRIRQAGKPRAQGLAIRAGDIRIKRFETKSDRLLIFAVDASGSAALARLAEAKGAVELLLAEAYARRDHVALVAFRGSGADLLLPPTRSLVQTKRRLAGLAGGGGTPLAAGLKAAMELAQQSRGRGLTPSIAVLTDGRANIALDGRPDRTQAAEDARVLARAVRTQATPALLIDTGNRPTRQLADLAAEMNAHYLPLPRADAERVSAAVSAALEA